jgi:hypothetical protein
MRFPRWLLAVLSLSVVLHSAAALDLDELFGEDSEDVIVEVEDSQDTDAVAETEKSRQTVRVGGRFSPLLRADWLWTDPLAAQTWTAGPASILSASLPALVFIDAKPDDTSRFYFSLKTDWPFTYTAGTAPNTITWPNLQIFELFSDLIYQNSLYFRVGKHTVRWGVGLFYSPADIVNIGAIDVEDTQAQREGPISLRLHWPLPGTPHNLWLYGIVPELSVSAPAPPRPEDLAAAAKFEYVLGSWELGVGAHWQRESGLHSMLTASGSLGPLALFGEAVLSVPAFAVGGVPSGEAAVIFSGTAGLLYTKSAQYFSLAAQYLFAGTDKTLSRGHYLALSLSRQRLFTRQLSASLLALNNLGDLSGWLQLDMGWEFFKGLSLSVAPNLSWGIDALWGAGLSKEYLVASSGKAQLGLSMRLSIGALRF